MNIFEHLLQLVSDPDMKFHDDQDSLLKIQSLIEKMPSAMESTQVSQIIGHLNGKMVNSSLPHFGLNDTSLQSFDIDSQSNQIKKNKFSLKNDLQFD